jgi:hypothetical protein
MNWEIFAQIGVLVIAYIGGLVTKCLDKIKFILFSAMLRS